MTDSSLNDKIKHFSLDPWENAIEPKDLYLEIKTAISSFAIVEPEQLTAMALWVIHTYAIKAPLENQLCNFSPILQISSPEKGCGKSTLREVIERLTPRVESLANASNASIYRLIESRLPTLFIDEADTFLANRPELTGILNAGYKQDGKVYRQGGKAFEEMVTFSVWCPKCIVGIGSLPETLESRSITIKLKRKLQIETILRINSVLRDDENFFIDIQRKLIRFITDFEQDLIKCTAPIDHSLSDRTQDNWSSLFKIAKFIDDDTYYDALLSALKLSKSYKSDESIRIELIKDMKVIFDSHESARISTVTFIAELKKMVDKGWAYLGRSGITPFDMAKILKHFDIYPFQFKLSDKVVRGYDKHDFEDVFNRYLS